MWLRSWLVGPIHSVYSFPRDNSTIVQYKLSLTASKKGYGGEKLSPQDIAHVDWMAKFYKQEGRTRKQAKQTTEAKSL